jgi:hypothetical protein
MFQECLITVMASRLCHKVSSCLNNFSEKHMVLWPMHYCNSHFIFHSCRIKILYMVDYSYSPKK